MYLPYAMSLPVPESPPLESDVAANFERFDGLEIPDTSNAWPEQFGRDYGAHPTPGGLPTDSTYTPGPVKGLVNVVGGEPLKIANPFYRVGRGYTPGGVPSRQFVQGEGTNSQGVGQTAAMDSILSATPVPSSTVGDIVSGAW